MRLRRSRTLNEDLAAREPLTVSEAQTADGRSVTRRRNLLGLLGLLAVTASSVLALLDLVREAGVVIAIGLVVLFTLLAIAVENDAQEENRGD